MLYDGAITFSSLMLVGLPFMASARKLLPCVSVLNNLSMSPVGEWSTEIFLVLEKKIDMIVMKKV